MKKTELGQAPAYFFRLFNSLSFIALQMRFLPLWVDEILDNWKSVSFDPYINENIEVWAQKRSVEADFIFSKQYQIQAELFMASFCIDWRTSLTCILCLIKSKSSWRRAGTILAKVEPWQEWNKSLLNFIWSNDIIL